MAEDKDMNRSERGGGGFINRIKRLLTPEEQKEESYTRKFSPLMTDAEVVSQVSQAIDEESYNRFADNSPQRPIGKTEKVIRVAAASGSALIGSVAIPRVVEAVHIPDSVDVMGGNNAGFPDVGVPGMNMERSERPAITVNDNDERDGKEVSSPNRDNREDVGNQGDNGKEGQIAQEYAVTALPDVDGLSIEQIDNWLSTGESGENQMLAELGERAKDAANLANTQFGEGSASVQIAYLPDGVGGYTAIPYVRVENPNGIDDGELHLRQGSIYFSRYSPSGNLEYAHLEPTTDSEGKIILPQLTLMTQDLYDYIQTLRVTTAPDGTDLSADPQIIKTPGVGEWVGMSGLLIDGQFTPISLVGKFGNEPIALVVTFGDESSGGLVAPSTPQPVVREVVVGGESNVTGSRIMTNESLVSITEEMVALPGREGGENIQYTSGVEVLIDGKELTIVTNVPGMDIRGVNSEYLKALLDMGNITFNDGDVVRILYNPNGTYDGIDVIDPLMESTKKGDYGTVIARVQYVGGSQVFTAHISAQALIDFNVVYPINCADANIDPQFCVDRNGNPVEVVNFEILSATITGMVVESIMQDGWLNRVNSLTNKAREEISPWVFSYGFDVTYTP